MNISDINPKVAASGLAGAITIVLVWILHGLLSVAIPPEVASAFTVIVSAITGWFKVAA